MSITPEQSSITLAHLKAISDLAEKVSRLMQAQSHKVESVDLVIRFTNDEEPEVEIRDSLDCHTIWEGPVEDAFDELTSGKFHVVQTMTEVEVEI